MFSNISIECLFSSFKLCNISIECKPGMFLRCCCPPMYCTWGHFRLNTKWIIQGLRSNIPFILLQIICYWERQLFFCCVRCVWCGTLRFFCMYICTISTPLRSIARMWLEKSLTCCYFLLIKIKPSNCILISRIALKSFKWGQKVFENWCIRSFEISRHSATVFNSFEESEFQ